MASAGEEFEFVIVGAGVFGLSTALALAAKGYSVTVLERSEIPDEEEEDGRVMAGKCYRGSSVDTSRVVRPDYGGQEVYTDLMLRAMPRWREWNRLQRRPLYHESGFLVLQRGELLEGGFPLESKRMLASKGQGVEELTEEDVARRFPQWGWKVGPTRPRRHTACTGGRSRAPRSTARCAAT